VLVILFGFICWVAVAFQDREKKNAKEVDSHKKISHHTHQQSEVSPAALQSRSPEPGYAKPREKVVYASPPRENPVYDSSSQASPANNARRESISEDVLEKNGGLKQESVKENVAASKDSILGNHEGDCDLHLAEGEDEGPVAIASYHNMTSSNSGAAGVKLEALDKLKAKAASGVPIGNELSMAKAKTSNIASDEDVARTAGLQKECFGPKNESIDTNQSRLSVIEERYSLSEDSHFDDVDATSNDVGADSKPFLDHVGHAGDQEVDPETLGANLSQGSDVESESMPNIDLKNFTDLKNCQLSKSNYGQSKPSPKTGLEKVTSDLQGKAFGSKTGPVKMVLKKENGAPNMLQKAVDGPAGKPAAGEGPQINPAIVPKSAWKYTLSSKPSCLKGEDDRTKKNLEDYALQEGWTNNDKDENPLDKTVSQDPKLAASGEQQVNDLKTCDEVRCIFDSGRNDCPGCNNLAKLRVHGVVDAVVKSGTAHAARDFFSRTQPK
jgi:hypothetical protein